jgi:ABC-type multidrug transport system fused ATPase/permease subunit
LQKLVNLIKKAFSLLDLKDKRKVQLMIPISVFLGLLDLVGVVLLGTVGTLAFRLISNDPKPTKLENILQSVIPGNVSLNTLILFLAVASILVLGSKTILQAFVNFKYLKFLAKLESDLSLKLFTKIIRSRASDVNNNKVSDYQYSLTIGANRVVTGIFQTAISFSSDAITTFLMAVFAIYASPLAFSVVFFIFGLTYYLINGPINRLSTKYGKQSMNVYISLSEGLLENFRGIKDVHVYKQEERLIKTFEIEKLESSLLSQKIFWLSSISRYFFELAILIAGVAIIAVLSVTTDLRHTVTAVVIFMSIGFRLIPNIQRIQSSMVSLRIAEGATESFFQYLEDFVEEKSNQIDIPALQSQGVFEFIKLDKVSFSYSGSESILKNISFKMDSNKTLAVIGESGSGKTTLADIIAGINRPTEGFVSFTESTDVHNGEIYKPSIGYVSQNSSLFGNDVYENIAFGKNPDSPDKSKIDQILQKFNLSFLSGSKYGAIRNTIRSDGTNLSGGERQRISIARVEYADPQIIIFDEPTSSLDAENKKRVIDYIKSVNHSKTIIIVTHDLELIDLCDYVLSISNGSIQFFGAAFDFNSGSS